MATKILRIEVCDICGSEKNLTKFRITEVRGTSRGITLCDDAKHGAPVLRRLLADAGNGKPPGATRGRAHVATMEEVKAARKKAAPPKRPSTRGRKAT